MKSKDIILCFSLCCFFGCAKKSDGITSPSVPTTDTVQHVIRPQHDIPWGSLAQSAWPKALHDAKCTGRSSFPGPVKGQVKYTIPMSQYTTDMVTATDSVFYIASDSTLYAITLNGTHLWNVFIGNYLPNDSPPMADANGIIYVGVHDGISAFRNNGTLIWHAQLDGEIYLKSCAIGLDGTIYTTSENGTLYAINQSGKILWQRTAPMGQFKWDAGETISFAPDGSRFYVGGSTAQQSLYALSTSGEILQSDSLGASQGGAISVDIDGNIYSYFGNYLMSVSPSGVVRWRIAAEPNWNVIIDPNGNIAYLSNDSLTSVDNAGLKRWSVPVRSLDFITHLVCDAQGTIFIETSDDFQNYDVQAISSTGTVQWSVTVGAYVKEAGPSLSKEGYLLFPHSDYYPTPKQVYVIE